MSAPTLERPTAPGYRAGRTCPAASRRSAS